MKKSLLLFILIIFLQSVYCQGPNWKQIATPFKSNVDIKYQTSKGALFGLTSNNIGAVYSLDNGSSWRYIPVNIYNSAKVGEDKRGRVLVGEFQRIFRIDLETLEVDTIPTPNVYGIKSINSFNDDFIIFAAEDRIYSINKNGTLKELLYSKNSILLTTSILPLAYVLDSRNGSSYLYKISEQGKFELKNSWTKQDAKYFLHGNALIRNVEFSNDEGKTWSSYNLPFTKPDSIFNYNGSIAFGKGNKIYYQQGATNVFNEVELPEDNNYSNAIVGKTIVTSKRQGYKIENNILLQPSGQFNSVLFDLETPDFNEFAPGKDECIFFTDRINNDLYSKSNPSSDWEKTAYKSFSFLLSLSPGESFSFNKDNTLSLLDHNTNNLVTSSNCGESWNNTLSLNNTKFFSLSENKLGTIFIGDSTMLIRKLNTTNWDLLRTFEDQYHHYGSVSPQLITYIITPFVERFSAFDTLDKGKYINFNPYYNDNFSLHYEMNYVYGKAVGRAKTLSARSFDNGATFETVEKSDGYYIKIKQLWTGHLIKIGRYTLQISDDYGKSWSPLNLFLSNRDYIKEVRISPDNYLYISTAEQGILKLIDPLPNANIIRFNIKEDMLEDCQSGNDFNGLKNIKVSLEGQATQLTDTAGNAVFYTFRKDNRLIIHNDAKTLKVCQDTIPVNFSNDNGLETQVKSNAVISKICPNLSLKFNTYFDSLDNWLSYNVSVTNNGNQASPPTSVVIELDPYLSLEYFSPSGMEVLNGSTILLRVDSLKPSESYNNTINFRSRPDVPYNKNLCISAIIKDIPNQCIPNEKISICIPIDRNNRNKTIRVNFYNDINGNCIQDNNEPLINEQLGIENHKADVYIQYDSFLYVQTKYDTNSIKVIYDKDLYTLCQEFYNVEIPKDSLLYILNIPVKEIKYCSKLSTSFGWSDPTRCFDENIQFYVHNKGNKKSENTLAVIRIDDYFDVTSISEVPLSIDGRTYTFDLGSIDKKDYKVIKFDFNISCEAPLGYLHCSEISLEEVNPSCNISTNYNKLCLINGGSYDPNDKTIFVSGVENKNLITKDDKIEYRIRFQNTGTDTAYTVRIEDRLDSKFDLSSMELIHTTHRCTWKILNGNLIVTFNNINLVDSITNDAESRGEIRFALKLKNNIKVNEQIYNRADIYFDFNSPIITNQVVNVFGVVSKVDDAIYLKDNQIKFVPNPTMIQAKIEGVNLQTINKLAIYSSLGVLVKTATLEKGVDVLDLSNLVAGTYFIIVWDEVGYRYGKLTRI
jgi:uncharacterized repeat protein (TIGR01451 family)